MAAVEQAVGYAFTDKSLITAALTHPSALEDGHEGCSYERLEFLGDSVVGLVIADQAFERYRDIDEGGLTRIKIALVSGETLSEVADELGFGDCIIFGESEAGTNGRGLHSALENVFEAVTGAIYLDGGFEAAYQWVLRSLGPRISEKYAFVPENPKSTLQEVLQAHGIAPSYRIVGEDGPPHDRTFFALALAQGATIGEGSGRSKKEAEAAAAQQAIKLLNSRQEAGLPLVPGTDAEER